MKKALISLLFGMVLLLSCKTEARAANSGYDYGWTKVIEGSNYESGLSVNTDSSGNTYVTGTFFGTVDFDTGTGVDNHTSNGSGDIFLTKYNVDGSYAWTETFGGSGNDIGSYVDISSTGTVAVAGKYASTVDFDPGSGVNSHIAEGSSDMFISEFSSSGSYNSTQVIGGTSDDSLNGVFYDNWDNLYLTGGYSSTIDFDPGTGVDEHTSSGASSSFLTKINSDGTYGWTQTIESGISYPYSVTVDNDGNAYMTGYFRLTVDFDPGSGTDSRSAALTDIYVTKFSSNGAYDWTRTMGSTTYDYGRVVTYDGSGNVYVIGTFQGSCDFDPGSGTDLRTSNGISDLYITKFNRNGDYLWTKTVGGTGNEYVYGGTSDIYGNQYLTGTFQNTVDFDPGEDTATRTESSDYDTEAYVLSISYDGHFRWVHVLDSQTIADGYGVAYSSVTNSVYAVGDFADMEDFDPYGLGDIRTTDSSWSGWFLKLANAGLVPSPAPSSSTTSSTSEYQIAQAEGNVMVGSVVTPIIDSDTGSQNVVAVIEPETFSFNAYLSAQKLTSTDLSKITSSSNQNTKSNAVAASDILGIPLGSRFAWQVGLIEKIFYKAYAPKDTDYSAPIIIPELQNKPSIVSLSYNESDLVPPGDPLHPFSLTSLKIAHSLDGLNWSILENSIVDQSAKTVSVIEKVGGYYMLVSVLNTTASVPATFDVEPSVVLSPTPTPTTYTPPFLSPVTPQVNEVQQEAEKKCFLWWCW